MSTPLTAAVRLWGRDIAAVSWLAERDCAVFQYMPEFVASGIEVSPLSMPLRKAPYEFRSLSKDSFYGLPGLLADSLPDKYGSLLIDAWLARQGRAPSSFNPVERLCYVGERAMGALEFAPKMLDSLDAPMELEIDALVHLANDVLQERSQLKGHFKDLEDTAVMQQMIRVGTSAGGARAKAVLAIDERSGRFYSGQSSQIRGSEHVSHWLIKFDGVSNNRDKDLADPQGYGRIEYAYSLLAGRCGIEMSETRLFEEHQRAHFMIKRFDRDSEGRKIHMQSFAALKHFDFNMAGAYSYEMLFQTMRELTLPLPQFEQQLRRCVFNIIARNQDDHVKNFGFLMDKRGKWRLSPAYDVTYSYNPQGAWTSQHQMSLNGKRDHFTLQDILAGVGLTDIKQLKAKRIIEQVQETIHSYWSLCADEACVPLKTSKAIATTFRYLT